MNAALRMLMRPTASSGGGMTDRLVRVASNRLLGFSGSATYAETTPLDSTHLHVAVVFWASATAPTTPAGWTEVSGGGNNSTSQIRAYARQGDGTVNSFGISGASAAKTIYLMGYSGFVSATAAAGEGFNVTASGGAFTVPTFTSAPSVQGVEIVAAGQSSLSADGTWDNGYTLTGSYPTSGAFHPGRKVYTGSAGSSATAFNNGASGAGRAMRLVFELV